MEWTNLALGSIFAKVDKDRFEGKSAIRIDGLIELIRVERTRKFLLISKHTVEFISSV